MRKYLLILSCAAIGIASISCAPRNRTVENPFIEAANTETLDITKVTVSDTATILHVEAYFRPKYWIKIAADSYLEADGEKYPLTGSKGIDRAKRENISARARNGGGYFLRAQSNIQHSVE